jgi:hypothetical protein
MANCPKCGRILNAAGICPICNTAVELPGGGGFVPVLPETPVTPSFACGDCGLSFDTSAEVTSHICLPESLDNKLRKEREDWWMTFLPGKNPNSAGNVVSNRCPTWRRIFDWVKNNCTGGLKASSLLCFQLVQNYTYNINYNLDTALSKIPYKDLSLTTVRNSYSQLLSNSNKSGNKVEVFSFTTDSSSAREYIIGDFTIILSGSGFNNSGGGAYSWGVRFYLCDSSGNSLSNFNYVDKRVSNSGSSSTYSTSTYVTTNWNTINYDFSPNTTYKVYAQLYIGNPFDGSATLQWTISNNLPTVRCFIMDKCPKQFDAFGIKRMAHVTPM